MTFAAEMPERKGISSCRQKAGTMPDIHDFDLLPINQIDKSEENIMEERIYTFYDKYQKVRYENVTAEELDFLNKSYNKDKYLMRDQYIRQNICLFSSLETEEGNFTDYLSDRNADVAQQITSEIFFKELFSDLTEREKKIVCENLVEGKSLGEVADSLNICYRQASRDKKSALSKMLKRMKAAGYRSYAEAEKDLLTNGGFAPTQMDAQNSIQRKRTGAVRLPSDSVKK